MSKTIRPICWGAKSNSCGLLDASLASAFRFRTIPSLCSKVMPRHQTCRPNPGAGISVRKRRHSRGPASTTFAQQRRVVPSKRCRHRLSPARNRITQALLSACTKQGPTGHGESWCKVVSLTGNSDSHWVCSAPERLPSQIPRNAFSLIDPELTQIDPEKFPVMVRRENWANILLSKRVSGSEMLRAVQN